MMEHQSLPVDGSRPQSEDSVDLVNAHKVLEEQVLRVIDRLTRIPSIDPRWLAIGRTHLELAFMAINRSMFKPGRVKLPEDIRTIEDSDIPF